MNKIFSSVSLTIKNDPFTEEHFKILFASLSTPENVRHISILPVLSKIFEKVLSTKLMSLFTQSSVLQCTKNGFREKHNTTQAVLDGITHIYDNIYSNNHSSVLTLDLKKAFDTVNHNVLLHKLAYYVIRGVGNKLLRCYLSNRIQALAFSNVLSWVLSYFQFILTVAEDSNKNLKNRALPSNYLLRTRH